MNSEHGQGFEMAQWRLVSYQDRVVFDVFIRTQEQGIKILNQNQLLFAYDTTLVAEPAE